MDQIKEALKKHLREVLTRASDYLDVVVRANEDDLRKYGYKFTFTDFKKVGKSQYQVYKIVPISNAQGDEI